VNWDKIQTILSNSVLATIATATTAIIIIIITTNATSTGGEGAGAIQAALCNNSTSAATSILPISSTTMANLGIPLTDSTAMGFTLGFLKG
jgi:hypothetical protein